MRTKQRMATFVGLFVALGLPFVINALGLLFGAQREGALTPSRARLLIIEEWAVTLILLAILLFWEKQPLTSIGFKKMSWQDVGWGLVGFVVGAFSFVATTPIVTALGLGTTSGGINQLAEIPLGLRIGVVLTAGITEEILSRGYPIERLYALTHRLGLSALIAYAAFVLLHIPFWGLGGTLQIGVWSIVVTLLYVKRRNLPACILMHILNDAYAFILLPMMFAQYLP
ncbi:type II CAAX endopeptidase family protein [uncultured Thermanaerothrix sp.]|uniref:CPBP family intramembrane glutamic endopeptidase n=1 Tax=uncultured Thermanaerothrix sp. TaxID=1195149 RepID=UPI002628A85B|nr:type II CAAX endopeptidase family protein [uncultured Thermanaerothrix sp.]